MHALPAGVSRMPDIAANAKNTEDDNEIEKSNKRKAITKSDNGPPLAMERKCRRTHTHSKNTQAQTDTHK